MYIIFSRVTEYRQFKDVEAARNWLNETIKKFDGTLESASTHEEYIYTKDYSKKTGSYWTAKVTRVSGTPVEQYVDDLAEPVI